MQSPSCPLDGRSQGSFPETDSLVEMFYRQVCWLKARAEKMLEGKEQTQVLKMVDMLWTTITELERRDMPFRDFDKLGQELYGPGFSEEAFYCDSEMAVPREVRGVVDLLLATQVLASGDLNFVYCELGYNTR